MLPQVGPFFSYEPGFFTANDLLLTSFLEVALKSGHLPEMLYLPVVYEAGQGFI
jgi:hypothetical protein